MSTLYDDCTLELAQKVAAGELESLVHGDIVSFVAQRSQNLERCPDGAYRYKKPVKAKARQECPECHGKFVNVDRHINRVH